MSASVGLDWFRGTFDVAKLDEIRAGLAQLFGPFSREMAGFHGWTDSYRHVSLPASISWCPVNAQGGRLRSTILVDLPGQVCSLLDSARAFDVVQWFRSLGCKPTRVDCRFDDYEWLAHPTVVQAACEAGNVSPFRFQKDIGSGFIGEEKGRSVLLGKMGAVGSGSCLLVYDKNAESKGRINACRWEAKFFGKKAEALWVMLTGAGDADQLGTKIGEAVGGVADFIDKDDTHGHLDRAARLPWFEAIRERLGAARVRVAPTRSSYDTTLEWMRSAYAYGIAVRQAAAADNNPFAYDQWIADLESHAIKMIGDKHAMFAAEALRRYGEGGPFDMT